jgi:hypothetical protein
MHRRDFLCEAATAVPVFAAPAGRPRRGSAQELAGMALPKPQMQGGRPPQLLNLRPGQKVLYGQTVGYPAKG